MYVNMYIFRGDRKSVKDTPECKKPGKMPPISKAGVQAAF